ncbi:MAG: DUF3859 domain-containing protein [Chitinophagaceae bacterium]|nr:DUF3859 domain-containing protein [Chitinophagaceae bacterium]
MKSILLFILILATDTVFSQVTKAPEEKVLYQFIELNHGLGAPREKVPANNKDSSAWSRRPPQEFKVIKATDSVPAILNTVFGVEFKVIAVQSTDVPYTVEWIYPIPMKEKDGTKYRAYKSSGRLWPNKPTGRYFELDEPYELLKGLWELNIYIENELKYSHRFIVH